MAIGVLGGAGVIVALVGERLSSLHKIIWAVLTVFFLVIEVSAIKKDHREQDAVNTRTIQTIIEAHQKEMQQTQEKFAQTFSQMSGLAASSEKAIDLSTETINQITGGSSYIYFECSPVMGPLEIDYGNYRKGTMLSNCGYHFVGKYPVEVHVSVAGPFGLSVTEMGKLSPQQIGRPVSGLELTFFPTNPYHFVIWINTSRGTYEQSIIFRKFGEKWGWGSRFYAYKGAKPSLIKKLHSPEFPADMMDADWDKI